VERGEALAGGCHIPIKSIFKTILQDVPLGEPYSEKGGGRKRRVREEERREGAETAKTKAGREI